MPAPPTPLLFDGVVMIYHWYKGKPEDVVLRNGEIITPEVDDTARSLIAKTEAAYNGKWPEMKYKLPDNSWFYASKREKIFFEDQKWLWAVYKLHDIRARMMGPARPQEDKAKLVALHALYLQAIEGDCPKKGRPWWFQRSARGYFDARQTLRGMSKDEAMDRFHAEWEELRKDENSFVNCTIRWW
jgi:acyl-CoA-binding protein